MECGSQANDEFNLAKSSIWNEVLEDIDFERRCEQGLTFL